MKTHAPARQTQSHASKPFFGSHGAPTVESFAPSFFPESRLATASSAPQAAHTVQRKCDVGESETGIIPQLEVGPHDDPMEIEADTMADRVVRRQAVDMGVEDSEAVPLQAKPKQAVQRKCAACERETRLMPQLEVGQVDDPIEIEADSMADRVVRRQAADRNDDEIQAKRVQAQVDDTASSVVAGDGLETSIAHSSGSGSPLASHTRDQMEEAFGADFSSVRVHTGAESAAMNDEISARAFTYGTDIHFNQGEYSPGTDSGKHLLAHELTHVVQQNSGVRRAPKCIQRKTLVFGPADGIPSGTAIHRYGVLPQFVKGDLNEGVWAEPPIPGANKDSVRAGLRGEPDFYRDNAPNGVPIGINTTLGGGFRNMGIAVAAPKKPRTPGGPIQFLDTAPHDIELGDLKPGHSPEEDLGKRQINNYSKGIKNTATAVNEYQKKHGYAERWDPFPKPRPMGSLTVPEKLRTSSSSGTAYNKLDIWEYRGKAFHHSYTSLKGSLIVYKSRIDGIWSYEWMPESVPESLGEDFDVKKLLERLNKDVKPKLEAEKKIAGKLKISKSARRRNPLAAMRRKPKPHKKFDDKAFTDAYTPWRADADKALGDKKSKNNEAVLEAVTEGKKRTGFDPKLPQTVKERAKEFATVRHWIRYGRLYGWLRKTFDRVYVKLAGFANWVKQKVKGLVKSGGGSGFGNWIKAAAMALFKVAKKLGAWAISIIVDKLLDSLQEGVMNILRQLAEAATPEAVKSKIQEVEEAKARFETMIQEATESIEKKLFGDKLEMFTQLAKYMEIANTVSTIVSVVKWGIRIVACASPPLLGCLWNLAIAALEYAFSKIMQTCWFGAKVLGWIRDSGIKAILDFPTEVASYVAKGANGMLPKLPEGIGPYFADIKVNHQEFNMKCGSDGEGDSESEGGGQEPTEEQKALMDLAKEVGDAKMEAFLEMAAKRAAHYNVQLDAERIRKLGALIKSLTVEQMKAIAQQQVPKDGIPVPVEEFLKSISQLTPDEKKRKDDRKIDYDKARKSNPIYEKSEIGWKPELFVQSGVSSDSAEFADAIYDIQKILGVKPDGMAGAYTTKAYYERNKVAKDDAYRNATAQVERSEATAAELKKIKEILAKPYPSAAQLAKDLQLFSGNFPEFGAVTEVDGRKLILTTTDGGARIGVYYKDFELTREAEKAVVVIDVSKFYTLDAIKKGDKYWSSLSLGKGDQKGTEFNLAGIELSFAVIKQDVPANSSFEAHNLWKFVQVR